MSLRDCLHCTNTARYIDTQGNVRCGIHDAACDSTSIKMSDVPRMIALVDNLLHYDDAEFDRTMAELRTLIFKARPT